MTITAPMEPIKTTATRKATTMLLAPSKSPAAVMSLISAPPNPPVIIAMINIGTLTMTAPSKKYSRESTWKYKLTRANIVIET